MKTLDRATILTSMEKLNASFPPVPDHEIAASARAVDNLWRDLFGDFLSAPMLHAVIRTALGAASSARQGFGDNRL